METLWLGKCWRSSKHRNRNRNKLIESLNGRQKRPKYIDLLESYSVLILDARARQVLPGEVAERDMCIYIYIYMIQKVKLSILQRLIGF